MAEEKNSDNKDYWRIVRMFEGRDFDQERKRTLERVD